jgi:hypothetical protein
MFLDDLKLIHQFFKAKMIYSTESFKSLKNQSVHQHNNVGRSHRPLNKYKRCEQQDKPEIDFCISGQKLIDPMEEVILKLNKLHNNIWLNKI